MRFEIGLIDMRRRRWWEEDEDEIWEKTMMNVIN